MWSIRRTGGALGCAAESKLADASSIVAASYVQRAIGVALVDSFTLNAGLSGFDWRPFTPAVVLPVTVMSQGNHLLSRHATALIRSIESTVQAWTGAPSARRRKPN